MKTGMQGTMRIKNGSIYNSDNTDEQARKRKQRDRQASLQPRTQPKAKISVSDPFKVNYSRNRR